MQDELKLKTKYGTFMKVSDFAYLKNTENAKLTIVNDE